MISLFACLVVLAVIPRLEAQPVITQQPTNQTMLVGSTVNLSVSVSGDGPFTYQWLCNGTNFPSSIPIITTVAGSGTSGYSGDGSTATNAEFSDPVLDVAVDNAGNLFISDSYNNRIRKVGTNGIITTVAGNGSRGYSGDGVAATNASLYYPDGVAVDNVGNLFIVDHSNQRIRKVDINGIITTVAGNGTGGYSGDGSAATNAELNLPVGVAVDSMGNLFIADYWNYRIRKMDTNGIITTVAGNGTKGYSGDGSVATNAKLYSPSGVTVDSAGNLFIADQGINRIRKVDTNGTITTVAGNGTGGYSGDGSAATNAEFNSPYGVALDSAGNLFIADEGNQRIRKVGTNGIITTVAGNGTNGYSGDGSAVTSAELHNPHGMALDSAGNLFIADSDNNCIREVWNIGSPIPSLTLNNVTAQSSGNYQVIIIGNGGSVTSSVATLTVAPLVITQQPTNQTIVAGSALTFNISVSGTGPFTYQWQFNGTNLPIITTVAGNGTAGYSGAGVAATNAEFNSPTGVAVDNKGNLFIADQLNNRIRKVGTNGIITTVAGNGTYGYSGDGSAATGAELAYPFGVTVDSKGNLFIADQLNNRIRKEGTNGIITTVAGNGTRGYSGDGYAATSAELADPSHMTVDSAGNLFIVDEFNNRIRKVGTNGIIITVAGNGYRGYSGDGSAATNAELAWPYGVSVDSAGNLFIADQVNNRIRKVGTNGIITTVAGNGTYGYSGDGSAATSAELANPIDVTVDSAGTLFIADYENNRIRKEGTNGIITTVAGNVTGGYSGDGSVATSAELAWPYGVAVDSAGNLFIADEYNQRIRKVWNSGSPFPSLTLSNVTAQSSGNYQVIITGNGGSVTSSVVALTVFLPPQSFAVSGISTNGQQLTLQFTGTPNYLYILQSATNLTPPINWQSVLTNPADVNGIWIFTDTNIASVPARYYRATTP